MRERWSVRAATVLRSMGHSDPASTVVPAGGTTDLYPPPRMGAMSDVLPSCPQCSSPYTYEMGALLVCPECAHEWTAEAETVEEPQETVIKDSVGNVLADGDTVSVVKDLKVKGQAQSIKVGTKVRNIRLVDPIDGHDISCKVDGFGPMHLKSSVVKKV
ncbi:hypothetical protein GCM10009715_08970 [Paeniglutamicibacter psychrophenolicus]